MSNEEFKQEAERLLPGKKLTFNYPDSFNFYEKGKNHYVSRMYGDRFQACRTGKTFQNFEIFDKLEDAVEWIKKIFKFL